MNTTILPPLQGLLRRTGFQTVPPFSLPAGVNYVPFNPTDGRRVLHSRPFLETFTSPGPGGNFAEIVSGDRPSAPNITPTVAVDGTLYYWDGSDWEAATPDSGETVTTGRTVFGTAFFGSLFIANDSADGGMLEYDYANNTLQTPTATAGSFPSDARVLATHMGTIWAAGSEDSGNVIRGSRTGDPYDWDFTFTDEGAPFVTTGGEDGVINEPVTALIPMSTDLMVVAGETSMMLMVGHPSRGGIFMPLSSVVGVLGQGAWTKTVDGTVFAMSHKGLVQIVAQGSGAVATVSEPRIPNDLKGLPYDRLDPDVHMAYEVRWNGVHIILPGTEGFENANNWWYDLEDGGFWRQSYGSVNPNRLIQIDEFVSYTQSGVLYIGDGHGGVSRWAADSTESSRPYSRVILGPVRLHAQGSPQSKSRIQRCKLCLSNTTDYAFGTVSLFGGADAEDAFLRAQNAPQPFSHTSLVSVLEQTDGVFYPRINAAALCVLLIDDGSGKLGFESLDVEWTPAGSNRMIKAKGLEHLLQFGIDDYTPELNPATRPGYAEITAQQALDTAVTDCPNFIDLSDMPSAWWAGIDSDDGREIKATDSANNRVPMHIIWFDKSNQRGMVAVKLTQTGGTTVRLWITDQPAIPGTGTTYGQFNAYPSFVHFLDPLGDGVDVTDGTTWSSDLGDASEGLVTSPSGFRASFTSGVNTITDGPTVTLPDAFALSFITKGDPDVLLPRLRFTANVGGNDRPFIEREGTDLPPETVIARFQGLGATHIANQTAFDTSVYRHDWAFIGGFTIGSPTAGVIVTSAGKVTDSTWGTGSSTPADLEFHTGGLTTTNMAYCMLQIVDSASEDVVESYYDMLVHMVDGDFWGAATFTASTISSINE